MFVICEVQLSIASIRFMSLLISNKSINLFSEVYPPKLELCPGLIQVTTSQRQIEVEKPRVLFRTNSGNVAPHSCTHFNDASSHVFPVGHHKVTCRGYDPDYDGQVTTTCEFAVQVKCE